MADTLKVFFDIPFLIDMASWLERSSLATHLANRNQP